MYQCLDLDNSLGRWPFLLGKSLIRCGVVDVNLSDRIMCSIPGRGRDYHCVRTGPWANPASYLVGTGGTFSGE